MNYITENSIDSIYKLGLDIIYSFGTIGKDLFFTDLISLCRKYDIVNLIFGYPWWLKTFGDKSVMYILLVSCIGVWFVVTLVKFIIKAFFLSGLPFIQSYIKKRKC